MRAHLPETFGSRCYSSQASRCAAFVPLRRRGPTGMIHRTKRHVVAFTAGLLLALCTDAAAGTNEGSEQDRRACTPDVLRLCVEFIPDVTGIVACLQQKVRELNPACRVVIAGSASPNVARQQSVTLDDNALPESRP